VSSHIAHRAHVRCPGFMCVQSPWIFLIPSIPHVSARGPATPSPSEQREPFFLFFFFFHVRSLTRQHDSRLLLFCIIFCSNNKTFRDEVEIVLLVLVVHHDATHHPKAKIGHLELPLFFVSRARNSPFPYTRFTPQH